MHGCRAELETLLDRLGYAIARDGAGRPVGAAHPDGRTAVFVGDLVDRGPDSPGVLRLVMGMVAAGTALCVPGNHEAKLLRKLRGANVRVAHGLQETLDQLAGEEPSFVDAVTSFVDGLVSHAVLDGGRLVVSHAGLKEEYQGRASGRVRAFCLYGDTTGETDEYGLPVRYPWANDYRGQAMVVYGHTPTPVPEWVNNTICVDTGCVFGGSLTALRYPSRELVSVPAEREYYAPGPAVAGAGLDRRVHDHRPHRPPGAGDAGRAGDGARRERGRRARGDEPVRGRPALAALAAADHGAGVDLDRRGLPGAPGRGAGRLRGRRCRTGCGPGEAHGLPGRTGDLPRRGQPPGG